MTRKQTPYERTERRFKRNMAHYLIGDPMSTAAWENLSADLTALAHYTNPPTTQRCSCEGCHFWHDV